MGNTDLVGDVRRLIVFDLDGTLVDSQRDVAESANQLIAERGGQPLALDTVTEMVGGGAELLVHRALEAAGLEPDAEGLRRYLDIYDTRLVQTTVPYPGIPHALASLAPTPRAVLTNKPRKPADWILTVLGLRHHFVEIVGGDGPFPKKPDPSGLLHLIDAHGATPGSTVLVGDSPIDVKTAARAGTRCCVVKYGFGFRAFEGAEPDVAVSIVAHPADLAETIEAL